MCQKLPTRDKSSFIVFGEVTSTMEAHKPKETEKSLRKILNMRMAPPLSNPPTGNTGTRDQGSLQEYPSSAREEKGPVASMLRGRDQGEGGQFRGHGRKHAHFGPAGSKVGNINKDEDNTKDNAETQECLKREGSHT